MILLIDKSKKRALTYVEIFRYMGVLCFAPEIKAGEKIPHERGAKFRAALVIRPEEFTEPETIPGAVRALYGAIPVFCISDAPGFSAPSGYARLFSDKTTSGRFLAEVQEECKKLDVPAPGIYRVAGIDASTDIPSVRYFNDPLRLTRTETMLLRVLLLYYPLPVSSKNLMKFAFSPTRQPELANVRTHISMINRKFEFLTGRKLVTSEPGVGYTLLTPERMDLPAREAEIITV